MLDKCSLTELVASSAPSLYIFAAGPAELPRLAPACSVAQPALLEPGTLYSSRDYRSEPLGLAEPHFPYIIITILLGQ